MAGLPIHSLLGQLESHPMLVQFLTVPRLTRMIRLLSRVKNDILITYPAGWDASRVPVCLPPSVTVFLLECFKPEFDELRLEDITTLWDILREVAWSYDEKESDEAVDRDFRLYGHKRGLTCRSLYPPTWTCHNQDCSRRGGMSKVESRQVVVFTLQGPIPAYSIHLYCEACNTNYHHNYSVQRGNRAYYDGMPTTLQVGEHQFVDCEVIELWISMMLVSWFAIESVDWCLPEFIAYGRTSATNCARLYNTTLARGQQLPADWAFGSHLQSEHVWDGFLSYTLLQDCRDRQDTLVVPHTGAQDRRFLPAVQAKNIRQRAYGRLRNHQCNKCARIVEGEDGQMFEVWVVVIDGVTIGHPCCAEHNCFNPLPTNRHRYCEGHQELNHRCAIKDCMQPVNPTTSRTCSNANHKSVEKAYRANGQARFQLKERLQRARVDHPTDSSAEERNLDEILELEEEFELPEGPAQEAHRDGVKTVKVRGQFGRRRTHNEQIMVAPCGVILNRVTFYGAEGLGSVIQFIKDTFPQPTTRKPNHIFFDNNCGLSKMVKGETNRDPFFDDIGLTVDVFHFEQKHSNKDWHCQQYCNPAGYPELKAEDGWFFNSSIAEQTNVWLGGYHSMCREMLRDKFNYFLDEMISRRNKGTLEKLERQGHNPRFASPM